MEFLGWLFGTQIPVAGSSLLVREVIGDAKRRVDVLLPDPVLR